MACVPIDDAYLTYLRRKFPHRPPFKLDFQVSELLKYLYLASFMPHGAILVSAELQVIWHAMLLETRAYRRLCAALPGRRLVHHSSDFFPRHDSPDDRSAARAHEQSFYAAYVACFQGFTEDALPYWPGVGRIMERAELFSMSSLNAFLCHAQVPGPQSGTLLDGHAGAGCSSSGMLMSGRKANGTALPRTQWGT